MSFDTLDVSMSDRLCFSDSNLIECVRTGSDVPTHCSVHRHWYAGRRAPASLGSIQSINIPCACG